MDPSLELLHFLAQPDMENCCLAAYRDSGGMWTIGVGHTGDVTEGQTCTYDQAMQWLAADLATASNAVNGAITVPMTQNQFDAFCSLAFNIGAYAFAKDFGGVLMFNSGDVDGCGQHFLLWDKVAGSVSDGLLKRRSCEAMMFLGQVWQMSSFADDAMDALSEMTLTRCMANYA